MRILDPRFLFYRGILEIVYLHFFVFFCGGILETRILNLCSVVRFWRSGCWLRDFAVRSCRFWIYIFYYVVECCGPRILIFGHGTCMTEVAIDGTGLREGLHLSLFHLPVPRQSPVETQVVGGSSTARGSCSYATMWHRSRTMCSYPTMWDRNRSCTAASSANCSPVDWRTETYWCMIETAALKAK